MTPYLRFATLNTWKGEGAYWRRLEVMARGLSPLDLDVLCLQEAIASEELSADTAAYLSGRLGLRAIAAPARAKLRRVGATNVASTSGLAILIRGRATAIAIRDLSSTPDDGDRIVLRINAQIRTHAVRIANLHLTHLGGARGEALRRTQAAEAMSFAAHDWTGVNAVCGDFNASLSSRDLEPLYQYGPLDSGPDPIRAMPSTLLGHGARGDRQPSSEDMSGERAIDHVLLLGGTGAILRRQLALTEMDETGRLHASDHAAVVADVDPCLRRSRDRQPERSHDA